METSGFFTLPLLRMHSFPAQLLGTGFVLWWGRGVGLRALCLHGLSSLALDAGFPDRRQLQGQSDIEHLLSEDPSCGQ